MALEANELQAILDNPESATPEQLEALARAELDSASVHEGEEQSDTEQSESAAGGAEKEGEQGEEEAPITSKDGKHTIPYDVLKRERESRRMAEQAMAEMQAKLDALTVQRETGAQAADQKPTADIIDQEDLEALKADFPALAKIIEAQMSKIGELEGQLSSVAGKEAEREQAEMQTVVETVQETIDANPKLLHLQTHDPEGWDKAIELDDLIKSKPENANLSLEERFNKVAKAYESLYGAIPAGAAPATNKPDSKPDVRQQMREKLATEAPNVPRSLSDIPGGLPPAASPIEQLANMNEVEMGVMFQKMTPQQIDDYLAGIV